MNLWEDKMFFKDIKRQKNIKNTAELKTVADIVHFIYPILLTNISSKDIEVLFSKLLII